MKNLERILAENMLRFGTKNINTEQIKRVISEQTVDQQLSMRNAQAIQGIENRNAAIADFNSTKEANRKARRVTYIQRAKTELVPLEPINISAPFYNNMVSLDSGLMPPSNKSTVEAQVDELVKTILGTSGIDRDSIDITITGAATTAAPNAAPDTRMPAGTKLDHPSKPFDGIDIKTNPQQGNQWLAKQRAQSIINILKPKLEAAGFKKLNLKAAAEVLPGGARDDAKRFLKVNVNIQQKTNQITTTANLVLNFKVSYISGTGPTQVGAVAQKQISADPGSQPIGTYDEQEGYKATVSISFGQDDGEFSFKGVYLATDVASTAGDAVTWQSPPEIANGPFLVNAKSISTPIKIKNLVLSNTTNTSLLQIFLTSCGRFTKEQVPGIIKELSNISSPLFKKLANSKTGTFEDFIAAAGGTTVPMITPQYGVTQIVDYTTSLPSFKKI